MASPEKSGGGGTDELVQSKPKTARARLYRVIFHNDDYTHKWFVAHVLQVFFHMSETTATALMMAIHQKGSGVAGVYTREIAETKVVHVMDYARENEMPLMLSMEPEDGEDDDG